jgi:hypothetical protein
VKKPLFLINETTWLKKEKHGLDLIMEIKEKNACGFILWCKVINIGFVMFVHTPM